MKLLVLALSCCVVSITGCNPPKAKTDITGAESEAYEGREMQRPRTSSTEFRAIRKPAPVAPAPQVTVQNKLYQVWAVPKVNPPPAVDQSAPPGPKPDEPKVAPTSPPSQ